MIHSAVEYAIEVWSDLTHYLNEKMENVRSRALRIIFFSLKYGQALAITNMSSLVARREKLSKNYVNKRDDPNQTLHHVTKTTQSNTHDYSLI